MTGRDANVSRGSNRRKQTLSGRSFRGTTGSRRASRLVLRVPAADFDIASRAIPARPLPSPRPAFAVASFPPRLRVFHALEDDAVPVAHVAQGAPDVLEQPEPVCERALLPRPPLVERGVLVPRVVVSRAAERIPRGRRILRARRAALERVDLVRGERDDGVARRRRGRPSGRASGRPCSGRGGRRRVARETFDEPPPARGGGGGGRGRGSRRQRRRKRRAFGGGAGARGGARGGAVPKRRDAPSIAPRLDAPPPHSHPAQERRAERNHPEHDRGAPGVRHTGPQRNPAPRRPAARRPLGEKEGGGGRVGLNFAS